MPPKPRNRDRLWVYLFSSGLFIGIAVLALLVTRGYAVDWDSLALQERGVIVLRADPDSAEITLDGKRLDKRTDARLSLAPDTYGLAVRAPGRIPWEREVRLDPGEAVIEEIILFPESPKRTDVTKRPAERSAVSPDGRRIAAVVRQGDAFRLQLLDDLGDERSGLRLDAVPERMAISDAGYVLTERAGRITVRTPTGRRAGDVAGSRGGFVGSKLVFQQGRRVVETDRSGGNARTLVASPRGWAATDRHVYTLGRNGAVTAFAPGEPGTPVSGTGAVSALAAIGPDAVQATGRDGSFGIIREGSFKAVSSDSGRATVSPDGAFVAYRTSRELRLFEPDSGKDRLVTSLTEPPARIVALPDGYYLLYRRGQELHAMARDGSNDRVVARRLAGEPLVFGLDRIFIKDAKTGRLVCLDLTK